MDFQAHLAVIQTAVHALFLYSPNAGKVPSQRSVLLRSGMPVSSYTNWAVAHRLALSLFKWGLAEWGLGREGASGEYPSK